MTFVQAGMATRLKAQAGFTLTEVTIIVAIIGLLVLVAVPNYLDWNRKYQLKDAVATQHGNIGLVRMNAINQSRTVTVTFTQAAAASSQVTVTYQNCSGTTTTKTVPITPALATSQVIVTYLDCSGNGLLPPMTLVSEVSLTNATGATVGAGVSSPQDVQFSPMGMRRDTGNANNLCITATGAYTGAACTSNGNQAFNFRNTRGLNYRIVVTSTGKASWCYTSSCAQ